MPQDITLKEIDEMARLCDIPRAEVILCAYHDGFNDDFSHLVYQEILTFF